MVRQVRPPEAETPDDLDNTSELPCLDVATYEEEELTRNGSLVESFDTSSAAEAVRLAPVLSPADKLQDIEAWIAAQDARSQAYQRSLEELQRSRAQALARAENLAIELEVAQQALHTALCRANDGERVAVDKSLAAPAAESPAELPQHELAETRRDFAANLQRLSAADGELRELREELARRQEHIGMLQSAGAAGHSVAAQMAKERDALAGRLAVLLEQAQSGAWRRSFWECLWQEQEQRLAELSAQYATAEAERTALRSTLERTGADLAARESTIVHLQAHDATQHAALEELGATRDKELHEVRSSGETIGTEFKALEERHRVSVEALAAREAEVTAARAAQQDLSEKVRRLEELGATRDRELHEVRSSGETVAAQFKALEERHHTSVEALAAREAEVSTARAAQYDLGEKVRSLEGSEAAHTARIAELEKLVGSFTEALQRQTEAAQHAHEQLLARDRELIEAHGHAGALESRLETTLQQLAAQAARSQASEAELAAARSAVSDTESQRQARERELAQLRDVQQQEAARAEALEKEQRDLALELERARGALDERDLQVRRLERFASSSAQMLNRIHTGIQRGGTSPTPDKEASEHLASLVPIGDANAAVVLLGRRTVIGRAPGNDVCLNDGSVSRRHAAVTIGSNGAFIEDLRSINGVKLNERRVRVAQLADGDVIELGAKKFRFTSTRHTARAAETA